MKNQRTKIALVTGASSGIGAATSKALSQSGWTVYAGVRRRESMNEISESGQNPILLDVTQETSMSEAVQMVESKHGAVDLLVNNAGYGELGPLEELSPSALRRQFETNVFGLLRMTQLVLPAMRKQRRGRIINISSMGGECAFPGAGAYHATKYSVEALTDVLRVELRPFGIDMVSVQPGGVRSSYLEATLLTLPPDLEGGPYVTFKKNLSRGVAEMLGPEARGLLSSEDVARIVVRAANAKKPQTRYRVGIVAQVVTRLRHKMPDRVWDAATARLFPMP